MMKSSLKTLAVSLILASSLLPTSANAAPDDFGRLFSRPTERKNLDVLRQNQKLKVITSQDIAPADIAISAAPAELPGPVTLQGYVKRSDGAATLWINNKAVQEGSIVDDVQVGKLHNPKSSGSNADSINVSIPASGKQIRLKAGQRYEPESNEVRELQVVEKAKRLNLQESGHIGNEVAP